MFTSAVIRLRELFGRTKVSGAFDEPEASDRARALTDLWDAKWPRSEPLGHLLRETHRSWWVRFHTLPGGKRHADDADERREILSRHLEVLATLLDGEPVETLVAIAVDWGPRDLGTGWSRALFPDAWPWRILPLSDEDPEEDPIDWRNDHYFWVTSLIAPSRLETLLDAAAEERAFFVLADSTLGWLYCPYDGGADAFVRDADLRTDLRDRFRDWRPAGPAGL